jgi:hypothetical protein
MQFFTPPFFSRSRCTFLKPDSLLVIISRPLSEGGDDMLRLLAVFLLEAMHHVLSYDGQILSKSIGFAPGATPASVRQRPTIMISNPEFQTYSVLSL